MTHSVVRATVVHRRLRPRENAFRYRVAYLCLGWPEEEHEVPELERRGWEQRQCAASVKPLLR